jgi:hypothetical protein
MRMLKPLTKFLTESERGGQLRFMYDGEERCFALLKHVEVFLALSNFLGFVNPFIFLVTWIKSSKLKATEFQCEPGPTFLKSCFGVAVEYISVMAEEDEVPLIVECDDSATMEVWCLRK